MRWQEYRRTINMQLPQADTWGFHRGGYPWIEAATIQAHVVRISGGQVCPPHSVPVDVVIILLVGEVEWSIESSLYALAPFDLLMIPANSVYSFMNVGLGEAMFFDVLPKTAEETQYYSDHPSPFIQR
jgi:quercetin dioxygenase-like cupin family protein